MVVPRIATSVAQASCPWGQVGTNVSWTMVLQSRMDEKRRHDVSQQHAGQPLQNPCNLVITEVHRRKCNGYAEQNNEPMRVDACEHLRGIRHAGEIGSHVDRVGNQQRHGDESRSAAWGISGVALQPTPFR